MIVDKTEEMVGSYGPAGEPYTKKFPVEEAPSGMLARGTYKVTSRFIDDDGFCHLEWLESIFSSRQWEMCIGKDW
jgi:hypothetical protein